ncbi:MBL fold metallo-hydrolase [Ramlibacter sp. PS4R-6]|uniref:MBL fold metallo-hydrolase n=1 Tax=Ramlibacter sp. PS4R-6 TaxID=3133438 RepID=UPI00309E3090
MTAAAVLPAGVAVLERGWLSSNNVVFTTGVTAVVDTGYVAHAAQTLALVRNLLGAAPLQLIVSTHLHSDHCGGNATLKAAYPSARTLIPPGHADAVARWDESVLTYTATGQSCDRFGFDALLRPGQDIRLGESAWQVHAAPGHDPHSVILFEPASRTLISADALWENGFGVVFPELDGEEGFAEVGATLDLIESLAPRTVIPGHGTPFGGAQVAASLARARSRLAGQVAHPERHAAHAMKVLIKFKLLEWQSIAWSDLLGWARSMPYMARVHRRFASSIAFEEWLQMLTAELERASAARREGAMLYNI